VPATNLLVTTALHLLPGHIGNCHHQRGIFDQEFGHGSRQIPKVLRTKLAHQAHGLAANGRLSRLATL
jgi:hypothetical protein